MKIKIEKYMDIKIVDKFKFMHTTLDIHDAYMQESFGVCISVLRGNYRMTILHIWSHKNRK